MLGRDLGATRRRACHALGHREKRPARTSTVLAGTCVVRPSNVRAISPSGAASRAPQWLPSRKSGGVPESNRDTVQAIREAFGCGDAHSVMDRLLRRIPCLWCREW